MDSPHDAIVLDLLEQGVDDWVPARSLSYCLWQVSGDDLAATRALAVEVVGALLREDLMAVGELGEPGFVAWTGDPADVLDRFISAMAAVNWEPDTTSWWFSLTEHGEEVARARL
ncbi:hypothetical protein [Actinokineospora diospyrosa]|uniref:MarR family transcriptional regulator n=1 Tax=Actinokineospora diospyrosa TaxID=103728 RepID=A0ABT1I8Q5_9PSEU|nr:hypothetical protein [Actinokineospora diospyrosa]MCP2268771.1 hypothetical protein [Actinokineospora diospyrosa]